MGKVYDALRKAESERTRRIDDTAPKLPVDWTPPKRASDRESRSLWDRLLRRRKADPDSDPGAANKRRIAMVQPDSYVAEQFRSLRARIDSQAAERPIRSIVVTSALEGEGKTAAAINLAVVTAMSVGRRVLLVDCDMRSPHIHRTLGLNPEAGLAEVLTDQASLENAIIKVEGLNLEVLAVRGVPPNPSELLSSGKMRSVLDDLSRSYDTVILDSPSALGMPDAKSISEQADGIVLVVRADSTPSEDVEAVLDVIDRRRILGLVLNGAQLAGARHSAGH